MQFSILAASALLATTSLVSAAPLFEHFYYFPSFTSKSCAVQASDYITYSIVGSTSACLDFCDSVPGCKFVNFYKDTNSLKADSYTCSLYKGAHDTSSLTNCGNQSQKGDGTKNSISESAGYFKFF